jgi:hypothetical protein
MVPPWMATPVKSPRPIVYSLQRLAARTEDNDAVVVLVNDDELVEGRARDAGRPLQLADTHMTDELALHAEHTRR